MVPFNSGVVTIIGDAVVVIIGIAGVAEAIVIGVLLFDGDGVVLRGAGVRRVGDPVAVGVVADIADAVRVGIALVGIGAVRAVVETLRAALAAVLGARRSRRQRTAEGTDAV